MLIAFVLGNLMTSPHGGIPTVNRQMLRQIARRAGRRDLQLEAWVLHDPPAPPADVARLVGLPEGAFRHRPFSGKKGAFLMAAAAAPRPDVIVSTHLNLSPAARLLRGRRSRVYQFLHGIECWRPLSPPTRWALRVVDEILSNSRYTHQRFLEENPAFWAIPAQVCWLGVPEERASAEAPSPGFEEAPPSVLVTARLSRDEAYKGHDDLIAVFPEVRRRFPGARLDIVGTGDAENDLRRDAQRRGLDERAVKFWGRLSDADLQGRYRACSVFAMPSRGEGFGLVYLEAMAFAKPCVASFDAAAEVVADGETGLLVKSGDREALLAALVRLLGDASLRARLGAAGRARLEACFTEPQFGERLWRALALGERPSAGAAPACVPS